MRHSPELIARVIGQMDSDDENVRLVAFGKAHAMLKAAGLKFADLHAAHVTAASRPAANDTKPAANTATTEQPRPRKPTTADIPEPGAYLHDPQVGFWKRSVRGKRVIANQAPPNGVLGRIRVLKDEPLHKHIDSDWRRMTLSFETPDAIYEPFVMERSDAAWLKLIRHKSATGGDVRFV